MHSVITHAMNYSAPPARRLVAAGIIRRTGARTLRITATQAGVTGSIRPAGAR